MKYYKTINYINNIWRSDGKKWWWYNAKPTASKAPIGSWVCDHTYDKGDFPQYPSYDATYYSGKRPVEISKEEAFIEIL